ncbi:unnamed protein product [Owenia fusiformis]|uniref:Uncharacterized protein n=1 Tax=Owenia fusiformis TaxID=6347 RepID=A0A8J1XGL4_OWEFU|nr:unnamed protein product [Owenia fusiformis]
MFKMDAVVMCTTCLFLLISIGYSESQQLVPPNATLNIDMDEDSTNGTTIANLYETLGNYSGVSLELTLSNYTDTFSVNNSTGNIVLTGVLDRETTEFYNFSILVVEYINASNNVTIDVTVNVIDVNDNLPIFMTSEYNFTVTEGLSEVNLGVVTATDADSFANANISYSLDVAATDFGFTILELTGNISLLNNTFDFESVQNTNFVVFATDNGNPPQQSNTTVDVFILDYNDNAPLFGQLPYTISITEGKNIANVLAVVSSDLDSGENSNVTYTLDASASSNGITIDQLTGNISLLNNTFDHESLQITNFVVFATDNGNPPQQSNTTVDVFILDYNDNAPLFGQLPYTISITEGKNIANVLAVVSSDLDSGENSNVTYTLDASASSYGFTIDQLTGNISLLNNTFDFESVQNTSFVVFATDNGTPPLQSNTTVDVFIFDYNDNAPALNSESYNITITEGETIGNVLVVIATDDDIGQQNSNVTYSLDIAATNYGFVIDELTGNISVVNNTLDYETETNTSFVVFATDNGSPPLQSNTTVEVFILDLNDNAPAFNSESYDVTCTEGESAITALLAIIATDEDSGQNGNVTYSLDSYAINLGFSIDELTGNISLLNNTFDYESLQNTSFVVFATDNGNPPLQSNTTVDVFILDYNDNAPIFSNGSYFISISESASFASVLVVMATDLDSGENGNISYSLDNETNSYGFTIDGASGNITLFINALDYEVEHNISFVVFATDSGYPTLQSNATVIVSIIEYNDNYPTFRKEPYNITVVEGEILSNIFVVIAMDDDIGQQNSNVTYSLDYTATSYGFVIDELTGSISLVNNTLDYETETNTSFVVFATDNGSPPLQSNTTVEVFILDFNDNAPVFNSESYNVTCTEGERISTALADIATDVDSGQNANLTYTLDSTAIKYGFTINELTGNISLTNNTFDYESLKNTSFVVFATDKGSPPLQSNTTVDVFILDYNDNSPIFNNITYNITVTEGNHVADILNVMATDLDSGQNSNISYSLDSTATSYGFSIDAHTGYVSVLDNMLDYESEHNTSFTIYATDNGSPPLQSNITVDVYILEYNDNSPIFLGVSYNITVTEGQITDDVLIVIATDIDSGQNSNITYSIDPAGIDYGFVIGEVSGNITLLNNTFDFESTKNTTFTVYATDQGIPSLQSNTTIDIFVLDFNDNIPEFLDLPYNITVAEGIVLGTALIVIATDADYGQNANVTYSLDSDGMNHGFVIDELTGNISLPSNTFDYESLRNTSFVVFATDNGSPLLQSNTTVEVIILDYNDNTPIFVNQLYNITIVEGETVTSALLVEATDDDSGQNSNLTYTLDATAVNYGFLIDATTGNISVPNNSLDYELEQNTSFVVFVTDGGKPALQGNTSVYVYILDQNDNDPIFVNQFAYNITVIEGEILSNVLKLEAYDIDSGQNSNITYSIDVTARKDGFIINELTGNISLLNNTFDYELIKNTSFIVFATDNGSPSLQTNTTVDVFILDYNDNAPRFSNAQYNISITEGYEIANALAITASDLDSGENSNITYSLDVDGTNNGFTIMEFAGNISLLNKTFDYELIKNTSFIVFATDHGSPPLQSNTTVDVFIYDYNDNAPMFGQLSYNITITEGEDIANVLAVVSSDLDSGENSNVTYTLDTSASSNGFTIDELTGNISLLNNTFDYESLHNTSFIVFATDNGSPPLQSNTTVDVFILDYNDNSPIFVGTPYIITLTEGEALPSALVTMATDEDSEQNGNVTYSLDSAAIAFGFSIDDITGNISLLNNTFDYESFKNTSFIVFATDNGSPPQQSNTTVNVFILDYNDNTPVIGNTFYNATIYEELPAIDFLVITGTDLDSEQNGNISYSLDATAVSMGLSIDSQFGNISLLNNAFDFEAMNITRYNVTVFAKDNGDIPLESNATIILNVIDYNDNDPVFNQTIYEISVSEFISRGYMTRVKAVDADSGPNKDISYTIDETGLSNNFKMNANTGDLNLQNNTFDFLLVQSISFIVTATDSGNPPLSSNSTINVTILDINNHAPSFPQSNYIVYMSRSAPVGSFVQTAVASDLDIGSLNYSVSGAYSSLFNATKDNNGTLTLAKRLPAYLPTVLAKLDVTDGLFSATTDVVLILSTDNINSPVFNETEYKVTVTEDMAIGTVIYRVTAADIDGWVNGDITYEIIGEEYTGKRRKRAVYITGPFAINATTGDISVVKLLNRETQPVYCMTILAVDDGIPPMSGNTTICVNITDANDETPKFATNITYVTLWQNATIGTFIATMNATDGDLAPNNEVDYRIKSSSSVASIESEDKLLYIRVDSSYFSINATSGILVTAKEFNFTEKGITIDIGVILEVEAIDRALGLVGDVHLVELTLKFVNRNYHAPVFNQSVYNATIYNNAKAYTSLDYLNITATDLDSGQEGDITYSLSQNGSMVSAWIDPKAATIVLIPPALDLLSIANNGVLELTVVATDNGYIPRNSTCTVKVTIHILSVPYVPPTVAFEEKEFWRNIIIIVIVSAIIFIFLLLFILWMCIKWTPKESTLAIDGAVEKVTEVKVVGFKDNAEVKVIENNYDRADPTASRPINKIAYKSNDIHEYYEDENTSIAETDTSLPIPDDWNNSPRIEINTHIDNNVDTSDDKDIDNIEMNENKGDHIEGVEYRDYEEEQVKMAWSSNNIEDIEPDHDVIKPPCINASKISLRSGTSTQSSQSGSTCSSTSVGSKRSKNSSKRSKDTSGSKRSNKIHPTDTSKNVESDDKLKHNTSGGWRKYDHHETIEEAITKDIVSEEDNTKIEDKDKDKGIDENTEDDEYTEYSSDDESTDFAIDPPVRSVSRMDNTVFSDSDSIYSDTSAGSSLTDTSKYVDDHQSEDNMDCNESEPCLEDTNVMVVDDTGKKIAHENNTILPKSKIIENHPSIVINANEGVKHTERPKTSICRPVDVVNHEQKERIKSAFNWREGANLVSIDKTDSKHPPTKHAFEANSGSSRRRDSTKDMEVRFNINDNKVNVIESDAASINDHHYTKNNDGITRKSAKQKQLSKLQKRLKTGYS